MEIRTPADRLRSYSPVTGEPLGSVGKADPARVREAIQRSRRVFERWRGVSLDRRREYLLTVRDGMMDRLDTIAREIGAETGKSPDEALMTEIVVAADLITHYAGRAGKLLSDRRVSPGLLFRGKRAYKTYEPYGVVGIISPWNFPFLLTASPIIAALFAGNAVILKPSETTPLVGMRVGEIFREAARLTFGGQEWARDLVQVVTGDGETGDALVRGGVDKICFTGSVSTGKRVAAAAAERLTPVVLELGGKDPMIVCSDADLERAAGAAVWGAFVNAGQACVSVERVYVVERAYETFVAKVLEKTHALVASGQAGSMTAPAQVEVVDAHIKDALDKGARVLAGGSRDRERGAMYYRPTVLADVDHSMEVMREETFGPVLPVMRVGDEEEAVRLANSCRYGLTASVFARDLARAREVAAALDVGGVCINNCFVLAGVASLPYGGRKESGMGYAHGDEGLLEFSRVKSVLEDRGMFSRDPQWYPVPRMVPGAVRALSRAVYRRGLAHKLEGLFRRRPR